MPAPVLVVLVTLVLAVLVLVQPMLVHVSSLLVLDAKTSVWPDS